MFGPGYEGDVPRGPAEIQRTLRARAHFGGGAHDRRPRADQGRGYAHGASAAHERRYARAARGHAGRCDECGVRGVGRAAARAERLHGPARPLPGGTASPVEGIFYAGTVTAPKNVGETICEGIAAGRCRRGLREKFVASWPSYNSVTPSAAPGDRHRPQQPAQERRDPARDARVADLHRLRLLHRRVHGGQPHAVQLPPRAIRSCGARRIPGAYEEMNKCMLCGKCRLVCRAASTRAAW